MHKVGINSKVFLYKSAAYIDSHSLYGGGKYIIPNFSDIIMAKKEDDKPAFVKRDSIVAGKEYAQLLGVLKERFRKSQIKAAVKVNTTMLEYYWQMGRTYRDFMNPPHGGVLFSTV